MSEHHHEASRSAEFPTGTAGLSDAVASQVVEIGDGDSFDLRIAPVAKRIGEDTVRMLAYNGSVPGPTLRVRQGSRIAVSVVNDGDLEATVHWHGLRLDNRYDGTHETQAPIPVGDTFTYEIEFPDPGIYWYHPHIREDYGQELGLYGNILVVPAEPDYWPPAHREVALTLDDVLIEHGRIAGFSPDETTHAAMGRFGNVFLVGGEADPRLSARRGEIVRFHLTNTANTRVFNVALPGARMKVVGGDSGRVEHDTFVDSIVLAPSERVVVDVQFDEPGEVPVEHRTPERVYRLATVDVDRQRATPPIEGFEILRSNPEWAEERERLAAYFESPPDKTLAFVAEMDFGASEDATVFTCPMHAEVTSDKPGHCPKCGMKLLPGELVAQSGGHGTHGGHGHHGGGHHGHEKEHGHAHGHGAHGSHGHHDAATRGIEWEDDMVEVNRMTTAANMRWSVVDRATGAVNHGIDWQFHVGDKVKLRLVNEMESDHPMHHPFHIHGAGRFVVLAHDGVDEQNLVWKDTVLVRTGETVDVLLDVTNPGRWMAHCHIAEHHESGMMFSFDVAPPSPS